MKKPIATEKGQFDQEKKKLQSTRAYPIKNQESSEDAFL